MQDLFLFANRLACKKHLPLLSRLILNRRSRVTVFGADTNDNRKKLRHCLVLILTTSLICLDVSYTG